MNDHNLSGSLAGWLVAAVLLFWFVGAYNRLVRLRSAALQAYATLDAALLRQLDFVQTRVARAPDQDAQAEAGAPAALPVDAAGSAALLAATQQLTALLASARLQPLDPPRIAALGTALQVLLMAWERVYPEAGVRFEPDGTLSRPVPLAASDEAPPPPVAAAPIAWPEPSAAAEIARAQFNLAVGHYNTAIAEFPALLVAWAFRLRPAASLN